MVSPTALERSEESRAQGGRSLRIALALTAAYMIAEVVGGILTGSLALLADAGHMFTDAVAMGLALFAWTISGRAPSPSKTFGYYRAEILAGLANGIALWGLVFFIAHEAWQRFQNPPDVNGLQALGIGIVGLLVNIFNAWNLRRARDYSLNIRSAYLNVLSDALGSIGVIASSGIISVTGWRIADPLASLFICVLIVVSSWGLIRESVNILMEGSPREVDVNDVRTALESLPGVDKIHDLHIWTLTTGVHSLSAHVVVSKEEDHSRMLDALERTLSEKFSIRHTTIQLDPPDRSPCLPDGF